MAPEARDAANSPLGRLLRFCLENKLVVVLFVIAVIPLSIHIELEPDFFDTSGFIVSAFISGDDDHFFRVALLQFFDQFFNFHNF